MSSEDERQRTELVRAALHAETDQLVHAMNDIMTVLERVEGIKLALDALAVTFEKATERMATSFDKLTDALLEAGLVENDDEPTETTGSDLG
jgi:hypothetical protein